MNPVYSLVQTMLAHYQSYNYTQFQLHSLVLTQLLYMHTLSKPIQHDSELSYYAEVHSLVLTQVAAIHTYTIQTHTYTINMIAIYM